MGFRILILIGDYSVNYSMNKFTESCGYMLFFIAFSVYAFSMFINSSPVIVSF